MPPCLSWRAGRWPWVSGVDPHALLWNTEEGGKVWIVELVGPQPRGLETSGVLFENSLSVGGLRPNEHLFGPFMQEPHRWASLFPLYRGGNRLRASPHCSRSVCLCEEAVGQMAGPAGTPCAGVLSLNHWFLGKLPALGSGSWNPSGYSEGRMSWVPAQREKSPERNCNCPQ
jgi:hypothetical protein